MKVIKFGGSSLATAEKILHAKNIVESDKNRRFVVVSAPGKDKCFKKKITDLLIEGHAEICFTDSSIAVNEVITRFENVGRDLNVDISQELARFREELEINRCSRDFIISRGEYFMALIFARILDFKFIDAAKYIVINTKGKVDERATKQRLETLRSTLATTGIVMGGFYGTSVNGGIKTFDRGGSDYTGAVIASLLGAFLYENFTDTHGVQTADPSIVDDTMGISRLDYSTLYKLASSGASIIYPDCLPLLKKYDVPLLIDNTKEHGKQFTHVSCQKPNESFFSITYAVKQNINKHTAEILCLFNKAQVELNDIKAILKDFDDVYLTKFSRNEIMLLTTTENLKNVVRTMHLFFTNR
ncbi:MAG: hypothetical protein FWE45_03675 [Firmicutes bacterium]|nr:hypothetical protein [Bacillota bacterium]